MKNKFFFPFTFFALLFLVSCKPEVKSGYALVPTVTENALSGVFSDSPKRIKTRLYYEEAGQGEPIILLHGHSVDCRMWDDVFFKLAKKYRVIRYDMRGYGKSDMPEEGYGFLHADDLKNFMDALKIKKAHFAGISIGGMALTDFVAMYPERVMTATISSGAITGSPDRTTAPEWALKIYNDTVFAVKRHDVDINKKKGINVLKEDWKRAVKSVSGKHYNRIKKKLNVMIDDWQAWQWTHPEIDSFIGNHADSLLSKQKKHPPILLLIGQYDYESSKRSMQKMAVLCPGSSIQIMPEAGYFTAMECPDEFVSKMEDFIEKSTKQPL